ncbi:S8 family serine peptidase [Deinococcus pimensis]|uniref:S8 family serine peptidase n=1 Tax=Deinococcus pimensis TaxID=309888 RepID=UPI00048A26F3|nr:S8 family serine peptidase [Deinococcus pimensis]
MKRLFLVALVASTLTACGSSNRTPEASVSFGTSTSRAVTLPGRGTWEVRDLPAWLDAVPSSGEGDASFELVARRPALASGPEVTGSFVVSWRVGALPASRVRVNVDAEMFSLSGRVVRDVSGASDVTVGRSLEASGTPGARGVIVKYRSDAAFARALSVGAEAAGPASSRLVVLDTPDPEARARVLSARADVEYAVPNRVLRRLADAALPSAVRPSDQYAALQWPYRVMGYGAVWRDMEGGAYTRPVTVAVVDTGTRFDHPDLAGVTWGPSEGALDFLTNVDNGDGDGPDTDPTDPAVADRDPDSHGTHVTGIIAARWGSFAAPCAGCSTSGVAGAVRSAPVKVLPLRVLDAFGNGDVASIALAVRYAAGETVTLGGVQWRTPHEAQVINLSLGGSVSQTEAKPLCDAVAAARARGALVVAAAGNNGTTAPFYPAACDGAVAVASVTLSSNGLVRAPYSSYYPQVMFAAPGGGTTTALNGATLDGEPFGDAVFSTSWDFRANRPTYVAMVGTSQAAPQVSALAALLLSKGVASSASGVVARLQATARDLGPAGRDPQTGFGMVDAAAALGAGAVAPDLRVWLERPDTQDERVNLPVDASGAFSGFVGQGAYRVVARLDAGADGLDTPDEPTGTADTVLDEDHVRQDVTVTLPR